MRSLRRLENWRGEEYLVKYRGEKLGTFRKIPEAAIGVVWFGEKLPEVSEWGK